MHRCVGELVDQLRVQTGMTTSWRYSSTGALLLDVGRVWETAGGVDEPGGSGRAWLNALMAVVNSRGRLVYVEGVALRLGLVMPHAWCANRYSGAAVEPTRGWDGAVYLGVPLDLQAVARELGWASTEPRLPVLMGEMVRAVDWLRDGVPVDVLVDTVGSPVPTEVQ